MQLQLMVAAKVWILGDGRDIDLETDLLFRRPIVILTGGCVVRRQCDKT